MLRQGARRAASGTWQIGACQPHLAAIPIRITVESLPGTNSRYIPILTSIPRGVRMHSAFHSTHPRHRVHPDPPIKPGSSTPNPPSNPNDRKDAEHKAIEHVPATEHHHSGQTSSSTPSSSSSSGKKFRTRVFSLGGWVISARYLTLVAGTLGLLTVAGGIGYYIYGDKVHSAIKNVAVDVTTSTLTNDTTKLTATQLANTLTENLLKDPAVMEKSTQFVADLTAKPYTQVGILFNTINK